jgi:hypothetical protein
MKSLYDIREYTVTKFLAMETSYLKEFLLIAGSKAHSTNL